MGLRILITSGKFFLNHKGQVYGNAVGNTHLNDIKNAAQTGSRDLFSTRVISNAYDLQINQLIGNHTSDGIFLSPIIIGFLIFYVSWTA